jgi:hypothetical protein
VEDLLKSVPGKKRFIVSDKSLRSYNDRLVHTEEKLIAFYRAFLVRGFPFYKKADPFPNLKPD